jgi:hemoglobin
MTSLYDAVGGEPVFRQLVDDFYAGVARRPGAAAALRGGPRARRSGGCAVPRAVLGRADDLLEERGHPRLRMRHVAWQVGIRERDAWLSHMLPAVTRLDIPDDARAAIWDHLERAAHSLVNWPPPGGEQQVSGPDLS